MRFKEMRFALNARRQRFERRLLRDDCSTNPVNLHGVPGARGVCCLESFATIAMRCKKCLQMRHRAPFSVVDAHMVAC